MTRLHLIACAALATTVLAGGLTSTPADARAKCVRAGAQATMLTEDLAKLSATTTLQTSISLKGQKGVGPIAVKCTGGPVLPTCVARQRACN